MRIGNGGLTVAQLVKYVTDAGMDMDTEIYPLGAKAQYMLVDRATKAVVIDEEPLEEYDNLECIHDTCLECPHWTGTECDGNLDESEDK